MKALWGLTTSFLPRPKPRTLPHPPVLRGCPHLKREEDGQGLGGGMEPVFRGVSTSLVICMFPRIRTDQENYPRAQESQGEEWPPTWTHPYASTRAAISTGPNGMAGDYPISGSSILFQKSDLLYILLYVVCMCVYFSVPAEKIPFTSMSKASVPEAEN